MPSIVNFKDLEIGSIYRALDTKVYVKCGFKTCSLLNESYQIILPEHSFPVAFLDEIIDIIPVERIEYDGLKLPYNILQPKSFFVVPHWSKWEVFYKISKVNYVYALIDYHNYQGNRALYTIWSNLDILYIHDSAHIDEIIERSWLKNQQALLN